MRRPSRLLQTRSTRLTFFVLGVFLFFGSTTVVLRGQSCPRSVDNFVLIGPEHRGFKIDQVDCKQEDGGVDCRLVCAYAIPNQSPANYINFYTEARWRINNERGGRPLCHPGGPGTETSIVSMVRQARIYWSRTTDGSTPGAAPKVSKQIYDAVFPKAVPCPGAVQPQPNSANRLPDPPSRCMVTGGRPRGKIKFPVGMVDRYSYTFDKWSGPITSEFPVFACDRIRTGSRSSAVVFLSTRGGGEFSSREIRIDMMADSILEIPGHDEETNENAPGFFASLLQGAMRWFSPETPGERRRREQNAEPSPFNVRTPTIFVGVRGTDFVLSHDPVAGKDYLALNSGQVEIVAGGEKVVLNPGQQIYTENMKLSPVYELKPEVWSLISSGKSLANQSIFSGAKQISGIAAVKGNDSSGNSVGIMFRGKRYLTLYQRQSNEGTSIDVYFFEIRAADGSHAEQDGGKLWGRFVRQPAAGVDSKGEVQWWQVDWVFKNGRWESVTEKGTPFTVQ